MERLNLSLIYGPRGILTGPLSAQPVKVIADRPSPNLKLKATRDRNESLNAHASSGPPLASARHSGSPSHADAVAAALRGAPPPPPEAPRPPPSAVTPRCPPPPPVGGGGGGPTHHHDAASRPPTRPRAAQGRCGAGRGGAAYIRTGSQPRAGVPRGGRDREREAVSREEERGFRRLLPSSFFGVVLPISWRRDRGGIFLFSRDRICCW